MVERHAPDICLDDNLDFRDMHHSKMCVTAQLSGSKLSSGTKWIISRDTSKDLLL